jgi:hypothetical protein
MIIAMEKYLSFAMSLILRGGGKRAHVTPETETRKRRAELVSSIVIFLISLEKTRAF